MPINYCHYYKTAEHVPQIVMIIIRCIIRITRIMRVFHLLFHGDAMQRGVWDQADPIRCIIIHRQLNECNFYGRKRKREKQRERERKRDAKQSRTFAY